MSDRTELLKLHDWDELIFGGFYCTHCTPDDEDSFDDPIAWPCPPLRDAGLTDEEAVEIIKAERAEIEARHQSEYQAKLAAEKQESQRKADAFNSRHPVGTPVIAYPFARPDDPVSVAFRERAAAGRLVKGTDKDPCTRLVTRTRSAAQVLGGHTDVVWVDGHDACIALTHVDPFRATDTSPEASAARWVPNNPRPLCRDFQQKPDPAAYWCANCGWNELMHADEGRRTAIAEALKCLPTPSSLEAS